MFYPNTAGSVTSFVTPGYPRQNYYPAPMSAVMPGQHYYPTMHAPMGGNMMYQHQAPYTYGVPAAMPYYTQPTVIVSSPPRRHRHSSSRSHSRSRSRGFLGYL